MPPKLTRAYKQSDDPRWYAGTVKPEFIGKGATKREHFEKTSTSEGVCFGLSIWWIIKKANKVDFWKWMHGAGQQVEDIKKMFLAQRGEDYKRFDEASKKIISETKLTKSCEVLMNQGTKLGPAGFYYISLRGRFGSSQQQGGHAFGLLLADEGKSYCFDPNYGEYECDSGGEAIQKLGELVQSYNVKEQKIYWCSWK